MNNIYEFNRIHFAVTCSYVELPMINQNLTDTWFHSIVFIWRGIILVNTIFVDRIYLIWHGVLPWQMQDFSENCTDVIALQRNSLETSHKKKYESAVVF